MNCKAFTTSRASRLSIVYPRVCRLLRVGQLLFKCSRLTRSGCADTSAKPYLLAKSAAGQTIYLAFSNKEAHPANFLAEPDAVPATGSAFHAKACDVLYDKAETVCQPRRLPGCFQQFLVVKTLDMKQLVTFSVVWLDFTGRDDTICRGSASSRLQACAVRLSCWGCQSTDCHCQVAAAYQNSRERIVTCN